MVYLFWFSVGFVFYSFLGYPLFLKVLSFFLQEKPYENAKKQNVSLPMVSLIISAYNEQSVIEDKILNSLNLNYPKELLEIVVVSDASSDGTDEITARYAKGNIVLRSYPERMGKTACLNRAVPLTKGEIIVFSDANARYDANATRELVKHFEDHRIGFVSGVTHYCEQQEIHSIGLYTSIEVKTKKLESRFGSCMGADGAIFAIRKHLYPELDSSAINDLVIPFRIIKEGFRGVLEERAFCVEEVAKEDRREFLRQVRITNRTLRAIGSHLELMNPFKFGFFSFELLSHKVCRLLVPFALVTLLLANIFLASKSPFYLTTLVGQLIVLCLACVSYVFGKGLVKVSFISLLTTFVMVNSAILWGWVSLVRGKTYQTWASIRYTS